MLVYTAILPFVILFSQHRLVQCTDIQSPHPLCIYQKLRRTRDLSCRNVSLELPTNFDVNKIPRDVEVVELDPHNCPRVNSSQKYCNVMQRNALPFPALPHLHAVILTHFTTDTGERFPVNLLLANVKHQIEELYILHSRIGTLDAEYLKGFSALLALNLQHNDITEILPDSFAQISEAPVLATAYLTGNHLSSFDWSVLQPLKDTLQGFRFNGQKPGLQTITRSGPTFTFKKLINLELNDNKLSTIPRDILDTFNLFQDSYADFLSTRRLEISLGFKNNSFCPSSTECSCCEMKYFLDWMKDVKQNSTNDYTVALSYGCGLLGKTNYRMNTVHFRTSGFEIFTEGSYEDGYVSSRSTLFKPSDPFPVPKFTNCSNLAVDHRK